ncbi:MAG: hypothetical protein AAEJ43_13100, partial [Gammaproteobacteria bacterium]
DTWREEASYRSNFVENRIGRVARPQGERQGWRESNLDRRRRARIADIMDGIRNTARVATP